MYSNGEQIKINHYTFMKFPALIVYIQIKEVLIVLEQIHTIKEMT